MRLTVFRGAALRTRRAGEEGQRRDDGIGGDDGVICNLRAVLDNCEFPLRKQTIRIYDVRSEEERDNALFTITQFFPIST